MVSCSHCGSDAIAFIRYNGTHLCANHLVESVEKRVKKELRKQVDLPNGKVRIGVALSGGKDSTVALHLLHKIYGKRRNLEIVALSVDEGVKGYRPPALEIARENCEEIGVPMFTGSIEVEYGITMDEVAERKTVQTPCTYCGVLRRQVLNILAKDTGCDWLATGLNLDDTAQSILMNLTRADVERLARMGPHTRIRKGLVPRIQPLRQIPEKETALYAIVSGIKFHDDECPHAERAMRGRYKKVVYDLEQASPGTRYCLLQSYDDLRPVLEKMYKPAKLSPCHSCGEPTVQKYCEACKLVGELQATRS
jgi:uncharacterized protein (TIGR00269 family)